MNMVTSSIFSFFAYLIILRVEYVEILNTKLVILMLPKLMHNKFKYNGSDIFFRYCYV